MATKYIQIDPAYLAYNINYDTETNKTTLSISIDQAGIPQGSKKINISYLYTKNSSTPAPQPPSGTVVTLNQEIVIDANTVYPIKGEFIIDGTPTSVNGNVTSIETDLYYEANNFDFRIGGHGYQDDINNNQSSQLEVIEGYGMTLRGIKI